MEIAFSAPEYQADGSFIEAAYEFSGAPQSGWEIRRNGASHLSLGEGYQLLKTTACGVCSTDLARQFLPFPLPQVTGHEVLATDNSNNRLVVEINASHRARGLKTDCPFCNGGLHTHCPDRVVLGIHDLPGGFGPHILAPANAILPVPESIPSSAAVLVEPLAAAINAVDMINPQAGETIAVLGPRRLGMLVVAALGAHRQTSGIDFRILALARHDHLLDLSREFGATETIFVEGDGSSLPAALADVVIDTTGNPEALDLAIRLARREVHLKSTHGRPSAGLNHLTELVVDELRIGRFEGAIPEGKSVRSTSNEPVREPMSRTDIAVVDGAEHVDRVIRPSSENEISLVKPRGQILLRPDAARDSESLLVREVAERGLVLSSSRCGDFRRAIQLLADNEELRSVGDKLITQRFDNMDMNRVFEIARSAGCIKAVVDL